MQRTTSKHVVIRRFEREDMLRSPAFWTGIMMSYLLCSLKEIELFKYVFSVGDVTHHAGYTNFS